MLSSSQFTRSAAIAVAALSLASSPAVARLADMPSPNVAVTPSAQHTQRFTVPRVDGMARRPVNAPVTASTASPVALTRASSGGGPDWLPIGIAAAVMLAVLAVVAVGTKRHSVNPFRARQV
jgi:hypothetical protein